MAEAFVTSSSFEIDGPYLFDYSVNANYTEPRIKVAKYIFFPNATSISGYENCQVERIFAPKCTNFNNAFNGNTLLRELYINAGTSDTQVTIANSFNNCYNLIYGDIRYCMVTNSFVNCCNLTLLICNEYSYVEDDVSFGLDKSTTRILNIYNPINGLLQNSSGAYAELGTGNRTIKAWWNNDDADGIFFKLTAVDHGIYKITDELYVVPGEDSINTNVIGGEYKVLFAIDATAAGASFLNNNKTIKEFVAPYLKEFNNLALTSSTIEYMYTPIARGFGNGAFQGVLLKSPLLFFNETSHTVFFGTNCFMNESGKPHHMKLIIQENPNHTKAIECYDGALDNVQVDLIGYRSPDEALLYYGQEILNIADYYQTLPTYFYGDLNGYVPGKNLSHGVVISGGVETPLNGLEAYTLKNSLDTNSGVIIDKGTKILKSGVYSNKNLDKIELLGCETLENDALNGAQIEEIYAPSVHTVGDRAFANNNKLKGAYLSIFFDTMGDSIFENCIGLNYAYVDSPYIPSNCFKGCTSLKGIIIGPYCTQIHSSGLPSSVDLYVLPRDGAYIKIIKDIEEQVNCNIYYFDVNDVGAIIQDDDGALNILISTQEPVLTPFESTLYANVLVTVHELTDRTKIVPYFAYCLNSKWISNVGIRNTLSCPVKFSWGFYPAYFYHDKILDIGNLLIEGRQPNISSDNDSNMELDINKIPVISNQWLIFPSEV